MPSSRAAHPSSAEVRLPSPLAEPDRAVELASRAGRGDVAATRELLSSLWPVLARVASSVLGARHPDLEDAVQQSMMALVRALPAFRGECHPVGYASRIALHVALRTRRRARADQQHREALQRVTLEEEAEWAAPDDCAAERRRRALRDLLEDLPQEQAEALALRVMLGWSLEETARATGAPLNTIRSRVRLAKEALRRRIEQNPELLDDLEVEP